MNTSELVEYLQNTFKETKEDRLRKETDAAQLALTIDPYVFDLAAESLLYFKVDRDELLKVADEINAEAEKIAGYLDLCEGNFRKSDADEYYKFAGWVDRIRKALGVER